MKRKILVTGILAAALSLGASGVAYADPAFGPGNSGSSGTQKCHPPGQTVGEPGCK
jgi:hypothetical protein